MPSIPIIGKPDLGPYPINMFYSQAAHKELSLPGLMGTPGLKDYLDVSHSYEVRGLHVMGDYLYAVIGNRVYEISTTPSGTQLSGTLSTTTGPVMMENDGTNIMLVSPGVEGYYFTQGGTVTAISDSDFPIPAFLTWQDGYFIVIEDGTGRFYISENSNDPTAWDALDFATAEGAPDNALSILMDHRELWVFGKNTTEVYYNSGNSDFPFERIQGAFIQQGIGAAHSVARGDNTIFLLDKHGIVMRVSGFAPTTISSRAIDKEISELSTFSDAIGYFYTHQGHGFYVLTFPTGDITWVYDVSTLQWHKRRSYPVHPDGSEGRWRGNCHAFFNGKHIIGDWQNGKLYELDYDTYTDNSETIRRYFDFPVIGDGQTRIRHNRLKLDYKTGVGLRVAHSNPTAPLLGEDIITNGTFASDTGWTKGTGWTITGGKAVCSGAQTALTEIYQIPSTALEVGKTYKLVYTISDYSAGAVFPYVATGSSAAEAGTTQSEDGTFTEYLQPLDVSNYTQFRFQGDANFAGKIDNVSLREVISDIGEDPKVMLQWSDDGEKTWSNELTVSLGKIGEYDQEVIFRRLGASKRRVYRNIVSDPVETVITGAQLN